MYINPRTMYAPLLRDGPVPVVSLVQPQFQDQYPAVIVPTVSPLVLVKGQFLDSALFSYTHLPNEEGIGQNSKGTG